jgi:3',5'-cyclic AMP phosphodiesterase CpdA
MKFVRSALLLILEFCCLAHPILAQQQDPDALYFIQISDPHWGCDPSLDSTERVVKAIKNLTISYDFVALTGDVFCDNVDANVAQQGLNLLKTLPVPVYYLAGNHDYVGSNATLYPQNVGAYNYALEDKSYLLLFISAADPIYNPLAKILAWTNEMLTAHPNLPTLLFHHQPFIESAVPTEELNAWRDLIRKHPFQAIFSGHLHRDALIWHDNTPEFTLSCLVELTSTPPVYRIYEVKNGKVSYQTFILSK